MSDKETATFDVLADAIADANARIIELQRHTDFLAFTVGFALTLIVGLYVLRGRA